MKVAYTYIVSYDKSYNVDKTAILYETIFSTFFISYTNSTINGDFYNQLDKITDEEAHKLIK